MGGFMKYIFSSVGGCGSSFLVSQLRKKFIVNSKPDTFFVKKGEPITIKKHMGGKKHQRLDENGLDTLPSKKAIRGFFERTGYKMDPLKPIYLNLHQYICCVQNSDKTTVLFNSICKFDFFSRYKIRNLVVLIRHPLHAYLSFVKPERHKNIADLLGGPCSEKSIIYYLNSWEKNVSEYIKMKDYGSKIIRYEFAKQDANKLSGLEWVFEKWESGKRNYSKEISSIMKPLVPDVFFKVYDLWDI